MGTGELNAGGVTLRGTSIPSRGSRNTPSRLMLQKPGEAPAWPPGPNAAFTLPSIDQCVWAAM